MFRLLLSLLAIAIAMDSRSALAEPDQRVLLDQFILSPTVQKIVAAKIVETEPEPLRAQCADVHVIEASHYSVEIPLVFVKEGTGYSLQSGAVTIHVSVKRCGRPAQRNLLLLRRSVSEPASVSRRAPGDFGGSALLEADTVKMVVPSVVFASGCKQADQLYALDARTVSPYGPGGGDVNWTFWACGKLVQVPVAYKAVMQDGKRAGTNMIGSPAKILDRLP